MINFDTLNSRERKLMDSDLQTRLERGGAIVVGDGDRRFVRASLQYRPRIMMPSRSIRRQMLQERFARIAALIAHFGAQVREESLSLSGQTLEAELPVEVYDEIVKILQNADVRVDPLVVRQVLQKGA